LVPRTQFNRDAEPLHWSSALAHIDGDEFVVKAIDAPKRLQSEDELVNTVRFDEVLFCIL
jgi:hypothetical protein